jgi:hypothetical protein
MFTVQQFIENITVSDFDSTSTQLGFQAAAASSMTGVEANNVVITSVTAWSRRLLRSAPKNVKVMETTTVVVVYNVSWTMEGDNMTVMMDTYNNLGTELTTSVNDGDFTLYLHQQSTIYDSSSLAVAEAVMTPTMSQPHVTGLTTPSPTHAPTATKASILLGDGAVTGIVIAVLVLLFAGAVASYLYYAYIYKGKSEPSMRRSSIDAPRANVENPVAMRGRSNQPGGPARGQAPDADFGIAPETLYQAAARRASNIFGVKRGSVTGTPAQADPQPDADFGIAPESLLQAATRRASYIFGAKRGSVAGPTAGGGSASTAGEPTPEVAFALAPETQAAPRRASTMAGAKRGSVAGSAAGGRGGQSPDADVEIALETQAGARRASNIVGGKRSSVSGSAVVDEGKATGASLPPRTDVTARQASSAVGGKRGSVTGSAATGEGNATGASQPPDADVESAPQTLFQVVSRRASSIFGGKRSSVSGDGASVEAAQALEEESDPVPAVAAEADNAPETMYQAALRRASYIFGKRGSVAGPPASASSSASSSSDGTANPRRSMLFVDNPGMKALGGARPASPRKAGAGSPRAAGGVSPRAAVGPPASNKQSPTATGKHMPGVVGWSRVPGKTSTSSSAGLAASIMRNAHSKPTDKAAATGAVPDMDMGIDSVSIYQSAAIHAGLAAAKRKSAAGSSASASSSAVGGDEVMFMDNPANRPMAPRTAAAALFGEASSGEARGRSGTSTSAGAAGPATVNTENPAAATAAIMRRKSNGAGAVAAEATPSEVARRKSNISGTELAPTEAMRRKSNIQGTESAPSEVQARIHGGASSAGAGQPTATTESTAAVRRQSNMLGSAGATSAAAVPSEPRVAGPTAATAAQGTVITENPAALRRKSQMPGGSVTSVESITSAAARVPSAAAPVKAGTPSTPTKTSTASSAGVGQPQPLATVTMENPAAAAMRRRSSMAGAGVIAGTSPGAGAVTGLGEARAPSGAGTPTASGTISTENPAAAAMRRRSQMPQKSTGQDTL